MWGLFFCYIPQVAALPDSQQHEANLQMLIQNESCA
jgi:hypothetical protein